MWRLRPRHGLFCHRYSQFPSRPYANFRDKLFAVPETWLRQHVMLIALTTTFPFHRRCQIRTAIEVVSRPTVTKYFISETALPQVKGMEPKK